MTAGLRLTWKLTGSGGADGAVEDRHTTAEFTASSLTDAPAEFLTAVTRLVAGATQTRAQFEAEPTAFRWTFFREGDEAWIRLLELPDGRAQEERGAEIWSGMLPVDAFARAAIRCFDDVARTYGESAYRSKWGEHFPRAELEALRDLRRRPGPTAREVR